MPSSLFLARTQAFAEQIGDAAAKRQIEQYLRHEEYPGPIVTFVGAAHRGKTTLFRKAASGEAESSPPPPLPYSSRELAYGKNLFASRE